LIERLESLALRLCQLGRGRLGDRWLGLLAPLAFGEALAGPLTDIAQSRGLALDRRRDP
jgi:hypothetical protein